MERRPMIGVVPLWDEKKDSIWMLPGYMDGITHAGGLPVILPLTDDAEEIGQLATIFDGFLMTGGHDVSPAIYNEELLPVCGPACAVRDRMETILLRKVLEMDKPVLGICRGIQFLNAALGGSLYQDLPSQHPSDVIHHQAPPYSAPVHNVELIRGTPLARLLQKDSMAVNSYHHQGIRVLAPALKAMAKAEDGLIEAVWLPEARFVWTVQWPPEFYPVGDWASDLIFKAFVCAAE